MYLLKRFFQLLVVATLALPFCCYIGDSSASAGERPRSEAFRKELNKAVSSMNVTFEASSQALTTVLNQMIGNEIYNGATKTNGLTANILRKGPITVTAANNYLYLTIPVSMSLRYGGFKTPDIFSALKLKLTAKITPDWNLNAEIYYMGLSDLFAEEMGIGPLSIKPRSIIEGITQPLQKVMSDVISRKINEKYSLKAEMEKVWNAAQKPVLLDKGYSTWLKITPQEIMLYPLYAGNNQVKLSLGLKSFAEVVVGPAPAAMPAVPLPGLKLGVNSDKCFRIALNTELFYKDILAIAAPLLLDRELGSDGESIILKHLDIHGRGDKLVVDVETTGSYNGVFSLTCKPSFNPQTNIFSVEDVDFDMSSRNLLLKSANWLLHGKIRGIIQEDINMGLAQRMRQVHEMAQTAMDQVKLADHIFLKGRVKEIKLNAVVVQTDKISVQVYAEGESTVHFQ